MAELNEIHPHKNSNCFIIFASDDVRDNIFEPITLWVILKEKHNLKKLPSDHIKWIHLLKVAEKNAKIGTTAYTRLRLSYKRNMFTLKKRTWGVYVWILIKIDKCLTLRWLLRCYTVLFCSYRFFVNFDVATLFLSHKTEFCVHYTVHFFPN